MKYGLVKQSRRIKRRPKKINKMKTFILPATNILYDIPKNVLYNLVTKIDQYSSSIIQAKESDELILEKNLECYKILISLKSDQTSTGNPKLNHNLKSKIIQYLNDSLTLKRNNLSTDDMMDLSFDDKFEFVLKTKDVILNLLKLSTNSVEQVISSTSNDQITAKLDKLEQEIKQVVAEQRSDLNDYVTSKIGKLEQEIKQVVAQQKSDSNDLKDSMKSIEMMISTTGSKKECIFEFGYNQLLHNEFLKSSIFNCGYIPFHLLLQKHQHNNCKYLGIFLDCDFKPRDDYLVDVSYTITILNQFGKQNCERSYRFRFENSNPRHGASQFITIDLLNSGYIKNGMIKIHIDLNIIKFIKKSKI